MSDTALFDLDELTPAIFDPEVPAATLTVYGRHHGLGPGVWTAPLCGAARYGATADTPGHRVWIWHACTTTGPHDEHRCDRCEETW